MTFVLDASVALAWCFEDEHNEALLNVLDHTTQTGAIAPDLWPLETLNALLAAERRRRITQADRQRLTRELHNLPVELDGNTAAHVPTTIATIAETHRLTAYDAAYLDLAIRRGLPLATQDKLLITAATREGVPLLRTT